ncbi:hypothetical protein WJ0W_006609 [Paenibacillus melissococcoides]|uniref:2-isopropylmalate synthase n=1 Tax=Paenibacillus melissococcoides TaxID=2912268 RepID=A0ABM9GBD7_9BACL|nr:MULTISPECIES: alpha-isopropylmalate synthase regulatory domain-containing protein [Paenibacillus]MEB9898042.1 alpha-isopropylmalate synthase regulatory domain-containing protein [Bacillus cereus]CAH8249424.1 hypothetical protein WJ0W_006609 [Paenibacillus melissococcoides]CAH8721138.1 hypothetical protein WDD9_006146 [Paenibacillus melissococcoides]CAH8721470.1 hypothetical protein HTL2_006376 [Paenibacillus melissococcoides]
MGTHTEGNAVLAGAAPDQEKRMIQIFDTTLRDGEQAPGAALTLPQKLELAEQLVRLGVDVIEPGFPISSPGEFEAVQRISPEEYGALFRKVRQGARGAEQAVFSAHCHNDLGLAVANSLAAIQAGATQIEVTVNGVGERTGNCALEELIMALDTRGDALRAATRIRPEYLYETSRAVSRMMHFPIAYNKPVVGRNAFQHESGIHQDGLIKNRNTYENMDPVKLGIPHHMIILGKHSGRHALKHRAEQYGVHLNADQLNEVYDRFKRVGDAQKVVTDDQLLQCIGETVNEQLEPLSLLDVEVVAGNDRKRAASVTVQEQATGKKQTYAGVGSGPIEAVIRALSQAVREPIRFEDLELHSLSSGEEASGEAVVTVSLRDQVYQGSATHQDIVLAPAQAYMAACNRALRGAAAHGGPAEEPELVSARRHDAF